MPEWEIWPMLFYRHYRNNKPNIMQSIILYQWKRPYLLLINSIRETLKMEKSLSLHSPFMQQVQATLCSWFVHSRDQSPFYSTTECANPHAESHPARSGVSHNQCFAFCFHTRRETWIPSKKWKGQRLLIWSFLGASSTRAANELQKNF